MQETAPDYHRLDASLMHVIHFLQALPLIDDRPATGVPVKS